MQPEHPATYPNTHAANVIPLGAAKSRIASEFLISAVLQLISRHGTLPADSEAAAQSAATIEQHLKTLAGLPDMEPILCATCLQLSNNGACCWNSGSRNRHRPRSSRALFPVRASTGPVNQTTYPMPNTSPPPSAQDRTQLTAVQRLAVGIPHRVTRLTGPYSALLHRVGELGIVTILSGNDSAIQERTCIYNHGDHCGPQPLPCQKWKYGFAVNDKDEDGKLQRSLQFFDGDGNALHKIVLLEAGTIGAYRAIVNDFAAPEQAPVLDIFRTRPLTANQGVEHIDINALRADWARINDTKEFLARQSEFDHLRLHKLRLAGKAFAHQVANDSVRVLLQKMADLGGTVMALVGNAGIVQTYQGKVKQIMRSDVWLNIVSPDYRLRLREDHIDSVWVAKKPTVDGILTSLELFNRQGISIARFFSCAEPGRPEPREWRDSILRLSPLFGA